jgi:hypothetical protein
MYKDLNIEIPPMDWIRLNPASLISRTKILYYF